MPGQQLVQMPDGKLHVLNTGQAIAASPQQTPSTTTSTGTGTPQVTNNNTRLFELTKWNEKLIRGFFPPASTERSKDCEQYDSH